MSKLYKTPEGTFYQESNGKQIPITDPTKLRSLYTGNTNEPYTEKSMVGDRSLDIEDIKQQGEDSQPMSKQEQLASFNSQIQDMLKRAQNAPSNEDTYNELLKTQQQQASQAFMPMKKSLIGASPEDLASVRKTNTSMYEPRANAIKAKIKADEDSTNRFTKLMEVAVDMGESFAKSLPLDTTTAKSYLDRMAAGVMPSEDVWAKIMANKDLQPEDITKAIEGYSKAKETSTIETTDHKNWLLSGGEEGTGQSFNEYLDKKKQKELPISVLTKISDLETTLDSWNNVKQLADEIKAKVGPLRIANYKGNMTQFMRQFSNDPRLSVLLAETEKAFQLYRKATTGAQASDKELRMLRPNLPSITESPAIFFGKLEATIEGTKREKDAYIRTYGGYGYDVDYFNIDKEEDTTSDSDTSSPDTYTLPDGTVLNLQADGTYN